MVIAVCGIAGVWSDTLPAAERHARVRALLAALSDRGPDCAAIRDQGRLSLGFCRLSIVGKPGPVQPVRCRHILAATNGEIFNHQDLWERLPRELRDGDSPSSDCGVVAPLAVHDRERFVEYLDGAFAGALADERTSTLTLFRDQVGIKPLFYLRDGEGLTFASAVSALVPFTRRQIDAAAMRRYLADGYVTGEGALVAGIRKVPPGSLVRFVSPTAPGKTMRWFHASSATSEPNLREAVTRAVRSEIPIHGPTVVTLSGGVDSTLVALLAAQAGAEPIALTVSYQALPADRDLRIATRVAVDHRLRHHRVSVSTEDYLTELATGWRFDQPVADPNAIALNRVCQRVNQLGSRVLLAGDGADEVFCGYPYYREVAGTSLRNRLAAWRFSSMTDGRDRLFVRMITGRRVRRPFRISVKDPLWVCQLRDLEDWLEPNLLEKADRFGMADQVEVRPPFLRKAVLRAGLTLPVTEKICPESGMGKAALRRSFSDLLPEYVLNRPKQGFPCPLDKWLRGSLGHALHAEATWSPEGLWDVAVERTLWTEHHQGIRDWGQQLWRLAVARAWWERVGRTQPKASHMPPGTQKVGR